MARRPSTPLPPSRELLDILATALRTVVARASGVSHEAPVAPVAHVPRASRSRRPRARGGRVPVADADATERLIVDGRWGLCEFTGKCVSIVKEWDPSLLGLPLGVPFDEEVEIWHRRWIVKTSTLGERHGYGVFACEDIIVENGAGRAREGLALFPYGGPIYKRRHWTNILTQHLEWKTYALAMDTFDGCTRRYSEQRMIDGDPIRNGNIAGFINSTMR